MPRVVVYFIHEKHMEQSGGYKEKESYSTIALLFFHATNNYASIGNRKRERKRETQRERDMRG